MSRHLVMSKFKIFNYLFSSSSTSFITSKCRHFGSRITPISPICVSKKTKVICQGISEIGSFHTKKAIDYGTKMVGFVETSRGGENHLGLPVYGSIKQAQTKGKANASVIITPPEIAAKAILDAVKAKLELVVCISNVLEHDVDEVKKALKQSKTRLIGPNCPGIFKPTKCKIGILHNVCHKPGCIGIVARCGNERNEKSYLALEQAICQTNNRGLGQSMSIGIGGDPFTGTTIIDCVQSFLDDPKTKGIIIIGGTEGSAEEEAAQKVDARSQLLHSLLQLVLLCIILHLAVLDIIEKMKNLQALGISVVESSAKMGPRMAKCLEQKAPVGASVVAPSTAPVDKELREVVWEKPPGGEFKGCADASVKPDASGETKIIGIGGFIRNSLGDYETGLHDEIEQRPLDEYPITPPEAEAYSILYTVEHAISEGLLPLTMENDNKSVVKKFMLNEEPENTLPVYEKLRKLVRDHQIRVEHQPNELTQIAHLFAGLQLRKRTIFKSLGEVHQSIRKDVGDLLDFDKAGKAHLTSKEE
ncbi:hypothetical protein MKX03_012726 [Papaver bracteatum]|nr:hypothetical protein MKX03_012726 [Papaver bracteatum]